MEMRALMVRSVVHYELKDNDEGDKRGVGEDRVRGEELGGELGEGEEEIVREWVEGLL